MRWRRSFQLERIVAIMKINKFLLQSDKCHIPALSEWFDPLFDDFRKRKRLEFLKLVAEGSLQYETVPCLCGSVFFDNLTTVDRHNIPQFTNLCVHCGLVVNMPRIDHAAYTWLYSSGMYRDLYYGGAVSVTYPADSGGVADEMIANLAAYDCHLKSGSRVLEIGCNTGYNLHGLRKQGFNVAGIEPDGNACAVGNALGLNIQVGKIEDLKGNGDFDMVIMIECFEHMDLPYKALDNISSFLKPGGFLYIQHIGLLRPMWQDIMRFPQIAHPYNYTLGTLAMVCRVAGFELVHGDERIVALFEYTGEFGSPIPDSRQYDLIADKFVGIELRNKSAIYRTYQRFYTWLLQTQHQLRRRFSIIDTLAGWLLSAIPALKSRRP